MPLPSVFGGVEREVEAWILEMITPPYRGRRTGGRRTGVRRTGAPYRGQTLTAVPGGRTGVRP